MTGASGQTDVFQSVGMQRYQFFGPLNFWTGAIGLMMEEKVFFKSVADHFPVSQTRYNRQDSNDYIYHGVIVKYNRQTYVYKQGLAILDLLSSLGGLFTLLFQFLEPLPVFISGIKFELGVMSLIFSAKTYKDNHDHGDVEEDEKNEDYISRDELKAKERGGKVCYQEVNLSTWHLLQVIWGLYCPCAGWCYKKKVDTHDDHFHPMTSPEVEGGSKETGLKVSLGSIMKRDPIKKRRTKKRGFHESHNLSQQELLRWYKRGKVKLDSNLRIEKILQRVLNLDIYQREMQEINIDYMKRIKYNNYKTVTIDTESSGYNTADES